MTKPNYQPYAFGGTDDPEDLLTCAEIEAQINEERSAGESCASAVASFTFLFSPSIWYVQISLATARYRFGRLF